MKKKKQKKRLLFHVKPAEKQVLKETSGFLPQAY